METYSGGYIEAIRYGYTKEAYYTDIASAYPSVIKELYDLRGSKVTTGTGTPPRIPYSYCFIRGELDVPSNVNFHPVTIKHFFTGLKDSNIRATGNYIASYTLEERDYLQSLGATFKNEKWYNVETTGKLSTMAEAIGITYDLRMRQLAEGNSAEYVSKTTINSMYGIQFECVDQYEDLELGVERVGYRGGEFLNTIYATLITSRTRIKMSKMAHHIEANGGKVILMMTDSVFATGSPDMFDKTLIREKKTLGYFEKPVLVKDMVCLGTGRYSYKTVEGTVASKKRGLNITDFVDPRGVELDIFDWSQALDIIKHTKEQQIEVKVRKLISVGMVKGSNTWKVEDLGRVVDDVTKVDVITGLAKRLLKYNMTDITVLCDNLVDTIPLHISTYMTGREEVLDCTLPMLRDPMMLKSYHSVKEEDLNNRSNASIKHNKKKKVKKTRNERHKKIYNELKKYGYDSKTRNKMSKWNDDKIIEKLRKDGHLNNEEDE